MITWSRFATPFGAGMVACSSATIVRIWLPSLERENLAACVHADFPDAKETKGSPGESTARQIEALFDGHDVSSELLANLAWPSGTSFQSAVLQACVRIPRGTVWSYARLAEASGYPGRARAAGTVMATNPLPLIIPCHRVVRSDGTLGHYGGGTEMKRWLLEREGALGCMLV